MNQRACQESEVSETTIKHGIRQSKPFVFGQRHWMPWPVAVGLGEYPANLGSLVVTRQLCNWLGAKEFDTKLYAVIVFSIVRYQCICVLIALRECFVIMLCFRNQYIRSALQGIWA
jgi:hypothetical protein